MKIENPIFLNDQWNMVRFQVRENDRVQTYDTTIPEDLETTTNKYLIALKEQHDFEELKQQYNTRLQQHRDRQAYAATRAEIHQASESLKELFELKVRMFEDYPFLSKLCQEDQSLVRRAPDKSLLNAILVMLIQRYTETNNLSVLDLYEEIEDHIFEKLAAEEDT